MKKTQNRSLGGDPAFTKWSRSVTVGERLRWLLSYRDMTQVDLAATMKRLSENDPKDVPKQSQAAGGQSAVSNILTNASRKPSAPTLLRMAAALQASSAWIMFGEGEPFEISTISRKDEKTLLEAYREMDDQAKHALLAAARTMARK